jgi:opacity protein-like surface antigen
MKVTRFQCGAATGRNTLRVAVLTVALLTTFLSTARAATDYTRLGPYLGIGVAGGLEDFGGGLGAFGDSAGFTFRAGYRLMPYLAVEGLYEYMDDFGLTTTLLDGIKARADLRTHNFSIMGKLIFPLGFVQPYLSGGVGFLNSDSTVKVRRTGRELRVEDSATEFAGRVGAGLDLVATSQLALTLDSGYVLPTERLSDFNYISFGMGVRYTF